MREIGVLFFLFVINLQVFGQNTIGIPNIINYNREIYNAGTQNRGIVQDKNGIIYFANSEGLLSFDGVYWKTYPLPNKTVVRSVTIGVDNKIYVGGQNDFGYFSPAANGLLTFTSLKPLLSSKNSSFTDIWTIVPYNGDIFFRSGENIFQYSNNQIAVYPAPSQWQFLGIYGNKVIAQDIEKGLLQYRNDLWVPFLMESGLPKDAIVSCAFEIGKDSTFITTITSGFYILTNDKISKFKFAGPNPFASQRILTAVQVTKDWIAVGTNLLGCYIINKQGEVIQTLSRKEGLQINNIIGLFVDKMNNLWLGLDNGIDFIAYNNSIKHIYPEILNEGEGYTSIIFKNELYVGTSNGVYKMPLTNKIDLSIVNGEFTPIKNTKGSSWTLAEINNNLLLGHHDGAFLISGLQAIPINFDRAYLSFLPYSHLAPSPLIIAGNGSGIDLLKAQGSSFISKGNIPGFKERAQFLAVDIINQNIIWVAHPYKGVYKVNIADTTNPVVTLYNQDHGLPSSLKNHLFKIKNRIVVTSEKGVYEYNSKTDKFEISDFFSGFFGKRNIRIMKEDPSGNIWFIEDKNLGVIDFSGTSPETIFFPELEGKMVSGNEHIYPYDKFNIFVGAEKGFYHINFDAYKQNSNPLQIRIRSVKAFGKKDSLLYGGYHNNINETIYQDTDAIPEINNKWNSFRFEYASPVYEHLNSVLYSYFLDGFDEQWSAWSKKPEKEYTNLPGGSYIFKVKTKNNLGEESAITMFRFKVLPPWFLSVWAYFLYSSALIAIVYLIHKHQKKKFLRQQEKHEKEQKQLQYLHQLELEQSEKEIVKLKNEKLQAEIEHKNKELASTAMHLVQKGEFLTKIKEELLHMKGAVVENGSSGDVKKILKKLSEEEKVDKDWEQFATYFDQLHHDFLKKLKEHYPNLSASELKLCAYLLMNLSSKEIAQLMNISGRGVEISRYRLRKKLQIPTETNLYNFLLEFSS